jgi:hypothetical protein
MNHRQVPAERLGSPEAVCTVRITNMANVDNRKDFVLLALAASNEEPVVGVTKLVKYLYLLQQDYGWDAVFGVRDPYRFEPYDFGPFDSQVYADLNFLENVGFVRRRAAGPEPRAEHEEMRHLVSEWAMSDPEFAPEEEDDQFWEYSLTEDGKMFASRLAEGVDKEHLEQVEGIKRKWNRKPVNELLRWLYRTHPDTATNARLKHLKPT